MLRAIYHPVQGLKHGAKIVLRGEAGCSDPSVQPGDVVFVLDQKEHRFFKRINQVCLPAVIGFRSRSLAVAIRVSISTSICSRCSQVQHSGGVCSMGKGHGMVHALSFLLANYPTVLPQHRVSCAELV